MLVTIEDLKTAVDEGRFHEFILETKSAFLSSPERALMLENELYYEGENPFLARAVNVLKRLRLDTGKELDLSPLIDIYSNFAFRIVDQLVNRLWYSPVQITSPDSEGKMVCVKHLLGDGFDDIALEIANKAAIHGACYAFWNAGHVEMFEATTYLPIYDERTGRHVAGLRVLQLEKGRAEHVQLYERDGFSEWVVVSDEGRERLSVYQEKMPYKRDVFSAPGGSFEVGCDNYEVLPIAPLYVANNKKSVLGKPIKTKINAYDLSETSYFDDFIKTKPIYWAIEGFSGEAEELLGIYRTLSQLGIIATPESLDSNANIDAKTVNLPYQTKKELQESLENSIFRDAQVINVQAIVSGHVTATAVRYSGIAEDNKAKSLERHAVKFIKGLMDIAGISGEVRFVHKTLMDDESVMRQIVMAHGVGVPVEALVSVMPILQGRVDEVLGLMEGGEDYLDEK